MATDMFNRMFDLLLGAVAVGALLGMIANQFITLQADTTNFTAGQIALLGICVLAIIIGIVRYFIKQGKS